MSRIRTFRAAVSAAAAAALLATAAPSLAAPTPVAPAQGAAAASAAFGAPTEVQYRRYGHRRHGGFGAGPALALGIVGLGIAAAIAASSRPRRHYYEQGYYPAYDEGYEQQPYYAQPQVVYAQPQTYYEQPQDYYGQPQTYYEQPYYQQRRHHGFFHWGHRRRDAYQQPVYAPSPPSPVIYQQPGQGYYPQPQHYRAPHVRAEFVIQGPRDAGPPRGGWGHQGGGHWQQGGFGCQPGQPCAR